ncbi:MAG TPA: cobyrinate a,c-diamide synthase [Steroidobacteraceae bacterium]|jgi:cobyrinic acid a,c-diamide synthase
MSGETTQARAIPRIVVAGAASNVGKTTIAAGLIAALRQSGLVVQPFKCGPDYIDPSYHERAARRPCRNLDTWMLNDQQLLEGFSRACHDADIAVIEGVMGLFDGSSWQDERGSTAQIAKLLDAPVLLVVDIAGAARSAAVSVLGCQHFDPAVCLCAVALNFAGSETHAQGCAGAIEKATGLPMLGWLPRHIRLRVPERHLGLVPGGEHLDTDALIAELASEVTQRFDLAAVTRFAKTAGSLPLPTPVAEPVATTAPRRMTLRPVLSVARDRAFCFYYPENLELLEQSGAEIEFFSPLRGEQPSTKAAGVYLGGGYPELHGAELAANTELWSRLKELHARDAPIYAECGGFMVLAQELIDHEGRRWPMAGLLPGTARMTDRLAALGYRHATALRANLIAEQGEALRCHEFHYSRWECDKAIDDVAAWNVSSSRNTAVMEPVGYSEGNLLASYLHVHFGQRAAMASRFVEKLSRT